MMDKKTYRQFAKGLTDKKRKPSWFARYSRKKLVGKLVEALKTESVEHAWVHSDFVSAVEKKPQTIVIYTEFKKNAQEGIANSVDGKMTEKFPKHSINIIDIKTLLPAIKESIFKEVEQIM
ncbi:MAG: hypothetical protein IJ180_02410 [Bacteroidales bacterium]|nr:hypothetical protein [Bacteroidales bacterium]